MFEFSSLLMLPVLAGLCVVMGMDNILSIAVITAGVEPSRQRRAQLCGLGLAFVSRVLVLLALVWILRGSHFTFTIFGHPVIFRDILKLAGGCFLIYKSVSQIREGLPLNGSCGSGPPAIAFQWAVLQILFADQTQSMDSLVTVVGMAPNIPLMIAAIMIELTVILFFSGHVARLISRYPSIRTLAVCALLLVGCALISEGIELPIPRRYIYAMMAFSLFVEIVNVKLGQRPVVKNQPSPAESP